MTKRFGALDHFRLVAALLVIAIHTSPLASVHPDADFFLTRVLARIAVPFFFMLTGYFVLSDLFPINQNPVSADTNGNRPLIPIRIREQIKKLFLLYGLSILLYLPLSLYAGHYRELTLPKLLRPLVFDGTFYHLWYFPACIMGILLICLVSRFLHFQTALLLSALLYLLGLLGDSYYGLTEQIPLLRSIYAGLFTVFSYTRNGLFFAPLFLLLGVLCRFVSPTDHSQNRKRQNHRRSFFVLFVLSFAAMTLEAFTLQRAQLQRHDSMYLFLVPVMFFLYQYLLLICRVSDKRPRKLSSRSYDKRLSKLSCLLYVIHPACIILIRGIARFCHLTDLLIDNSLIHYLAVSLCSITATASCLLLSDAARSRFWKRPQTEGRRNIPFMKQGTVTGFCKENKGKATARAWLELDMSALEKNVTYLRSLIPSGCKLMPAVKANAYGHGANLIAARLNCLGIFDFCVASALEGIALRRAGIKGQIVILGYTHPSLFRQLKQYHLTQTVIDYEYAELLEQSGIKLPVHVAIDTGMHRLGIRCEESDKIYRVYQMKNLVINGMFTHLAACDSSLPNNREYTFHQLRSFYQVVDTLKEKGIVCKNLHLLSSYGILNYPEAAGDFVRPGILLYGVHSSSQSKKLYPVLSLKARVSSVRCLKAGECAGYGMDFTASCDTLIAVLTIGYADGLPRDLSCERGQVLLHGHRAPIIGRICMDQTLVNITGIPSVRSGDIAVLIGGSEKEFISAEEVADKCGTITNELLSRLGSRLERITKE